MVVELAAVLLSSGARAAGGARVEQGVQLGGLPGKRGRRRCRAAGELGGGGPAAGQQRDQRKPRSPPGCRAVPSRLDGPGRRGGRAARRRAGRPAWASGAAQAARAAGLGWLSPALFGPDQPWSLAPVPYRAVPRLTVSWLSRWLARASRSRLPGRRANLLGRPAFLRVAAWGFMHVVHDSEAAVMVWDTSQQSLGAVCERPQNLPRMGASCAPRKDYMRSGTGMPSRSSPASSTRRVSADRASLLLRTDSSGACRTGHFS